jgi:hypothetical protein
MLLMIASWSHSNGHNVLHLAYLYENVEQCTFIIFLVPDSDLCFLHVSCHFLHPKLMCISCLDLSYTILLGLSNLVF